MGIDCLIDSGFDGDLQLPAERSGWFEGQRALHIEVMLANGEVVPAKSFACDVQIGSDVQEVRATLMGVGAAIGMRLLKGRILRMHVAPLSPITLERP